MIALIPEDDPYLLQPPNEFIWFDDEPDKAVDLQKKLIDNMLYYGGVGLSANQLGLPYRVFVMLHEGQPLTVFNPRVIQKSSDEVYMMEGCLSYPGLFVKVKRPENMTMEWYTEEGTRCEERFVGMTSRILQHEVDHLNGITFLKRAVSYHLQKARKDRKIQGRRRKKTQE